ncbi:hypothetical protein DVW16_12435, partial [Enterococcus faecium]
NLSQNVVHSDSDLILHNSSVLIDKEPFHLSHRYKINYFSESSVAFSSTSSFNASPKMSPIVNPVFSSGNS